MLNPKLIGTYTFFIESTDVWSIPNTYIYSQQMELFITCDLDSFVIDYSKIVFASQENLIVHDITDTSPLIFNITGLENQVTGCVVEAVDLWTLSDQSGSMVSQVKAGVAESVGSSNYTFEMEDGYVD